MHIQAAIFDLDGLLLDTERTAREAWVQVAAESDVSIPDALVASMVGRRIPDIIALLAEYVGSAEHASHLMARSHVHYEAIVDARPVDVKAGAHELFDALDAMGIPRAIATSSKRQYFAHKTRASGLPERVRAVVCGDEVEHGKPAPDIYLAAAEALGIEPKACLAFEDSGPGIASASSAGMLAVLVPDHGEPSAATLAIASAVFRDLRDCIPYVRTAAGHAPG